MENTSVLVCVTDQKRCERLIIAGAAISKEIGARTVVVHVARENGKMLGGESTPQALEYLLQVSVAHGADMVVIRSDDVVSTLENQARSLNAKVIVAGRADNYAGHDVLDDLGERLPEVEIRIK